MSETIKNRSEILFIYDVTDANPNGDPVDENKPRIEEETGINFVTDVRLKRTIRDYLLNFKNEGIFVKEVEYEPGKIQDAKLRAEDFLIDDNGKKLTKKDIIDLVKVTKPSAKESDFLQKMKEIIDKNIKKLIDVRLFGITLPVEWNEKNKSSITNTGPVQFKIGRSLFKVSPTYIKGTGAFASEKNKEQKTFREEYILPYSLISFYGIVNENASLTQGLNLSNEDISKLLDGIWNGTKNLISRSKAGQMPRLILWVEHKEQNYHIGELDKMVHFISDKEDEEIRSVADGTLDITELVDTIKKNKEKINRIQYKVDERLHLSYNSETKILSEAFSGFNIKEFDF